MKNLRFLTVLVLLSATALILLRRGTSERTVQSEPLADVPSIIEGWSSYDQPIDSETLEVLGNGEFLSRIYTHNGAPAIGLFIAYFASQRTGATMHSPRNCLPGSGWDFESSQYVNLADANGKIHRVGEYIIANGDRRQIVIYWYQAHGRSVANEYMAKAYLVSDAIRMNRTDGALVRVVTAIAGNEGQPAARARAEGFVAQLMPTLPRFIPN